jgi:hypothetical protein
VAGVEVLTERLAEWLAAHGNEVEVVCAEQIDADQHLTVRSEQRNGVTVHRLGLRLEAADTSRLGFRFQDEALRRWFAQYLERSRPDLLHSQSSYLITTSLIEAAKAANVPVVATLHDYWYFCPRVTLLRSNGSLCTGQVTPAECTACLMGERRRNRLMLSVTERLWNGTAFVRGADRVPSWPLDRALL